MAGEERMVERVARVLEPQAWRALGIGDTIAYQSRRTSSLRKARSAIAIMREPTGPQMDAHHRAFNNLLSDGGDDKDVWRAMIDAALEGGSSS